MWMEMGAVALMERRMRIMNYFMQKYIEYPPLKVKSIHR
jgi:hypothetical protein